MMYLLSCGLRISEKTRGGGEEKLGQRISTFFLVSRSGVYPSEMLDRWLEPPTKPDEDESIPDAHVIHAVSEPEDGGFGGIG